MPEAFTVANIFTAVGIILAIALLSVIALLSLRGRLTVAYDGEFSISFGVLFFNLRLLPVRERKKRYRRSMSRSRARRIRKSVQKREERRKAFRERLFGKKEQKQTKQGTGDKSNEEKTASPDIPISLVARETIDILSVFTEVIAIIVKRFTHHLKIKIARFKIRIATEDPAITAVTYGAATGILNVLLPILSTVDNLKLPKERQFDVSTDFVATVPEIDMKVTFYLRTWHMADILIRTLFGGISKYVSRKGGIDKTFAHIADVISRLSPKDEGENKKENNKK